MDTVDRIEQREQEREQKMVQRVMDFCRAALDIASVYGEFDDLDVREQVGANLAEAKIATIVYSPFTRESHAKTACNNILMNTARACDHMTNPNGRWQTSFTETVSV